MKWLTRDRQFYKSLIALAIPVAAQNLITFLIGFADNLMVGTLGDSAISGVYMGGQVQTLLQVLGAGIEGAMLILSAQYWGKRDLSAIRKIVSIGLRISLLFSLAVMLFCAISPAFVISLFTSEASVITDGAVYLLILCFSFPFFCLSQSLISALRAVENTRPGMYVSLISLGINVILNYLLIFGKLGFPALGIAGAAIATLIARIAEAAFMVLYHRFIDKTLHLRFADLLGFDAPLFRDFIRYGTPVIAGQLVWATNLLGSGAILGRFGEVTISAASVANTMNTLAYVTMNGLASAVGIITGKTVGSGDVEKVKEYARTVQLLFLGLGIVTGGMVFLLRHPFTALYTGITPLARAEAIRFLTVLSVTIIGTCYQAASLMGLVKAGGDVSFVFRQDTIFIFLVVLPSAMLASYFGAPTWVVFLCLKCDQILKCIVAAVKINRFNWMKNLTRGA